MPKRSRSGVASRPARVVAPTRVNGDEVDAHAARRRPLADDEVELEILHRRIQHFLDGRLQAVDFVDEQHVARLQVGQDRGEVAGALDHRPGGGAEARRRVRGRRSAPAWSCRGRAGRAAARGRAPRRGRGRPAMNTARFSRVACWPMNSASVCGRSDWPRRRLPRRGRGRRYARARSWQPHGARRNQFRPRRSSPTRAPGERLKLLDRRLDQDGFAVVGRGIGPQHCNRTPARNDDVPSVLRQVPTTKRLYRSNRSAMKRSNRPTSAILREGTSGPGDLVDVQSQLDAACGAARSTLRSQRSRLQTHGPARFLRERGAGTRSPRSFRWSSAV